MKKVDDFIERKELERCKFGHNRIMVIIDSLPIFEQFTKIVGTAIYCIDNRNDENMNKQKR